MKALLLSLAIAAGAGGANAQPADALVQAIIPRSAQAAAQRPELDHTRPRAPPRYASPLPAGVARTAIDRRFGDDDAVGSFGYLCGLNPGQKMTGAAGAAGYDPMGKFLGAKLSFAFR
jgi:hypothetical protein